VHRKRRDNTKVSLQGQEEGQQFSDRRHFRDENEVRGKENEIRLEHV
jgi:hypothetical protein